MSSHISCTKRYADNMLENKECWDDEKEPEVRTASGSKNLKK
jgi:hypothetical protein